MMAPETRNIVVLVGVGFAVAVVTAVLGSCCLV